MTKERIEKELTKVREQPCRIAGKTEGLGGAVADGRGCGEDEIH